MLDIMYDIFNPKTSYKAYPKSPQFFKKKEQEKTQNHSNISILNKTHISKYITKCISRERLTDSQ